MDIVPVVWLEPGQQWDQHTFELLLNNWLYQTPNRYKFEHFEDFPKAEGIVLVVPQKYYIDKVEWLNERVAQYKWLLYIGTGNEEGEFPLSQLKHPNIKIYYTTPNLKNTPLELVDRFFGDGFAPQSEVIKDFSELALTKPLDLYFGGQITHKRRTQCVEAIKRLQLDPQVKVELLETAGFTQGYDDPREYYKRMASAKITPCPSGPANQDTFRTYEALEAMSMPIVDSRTPFDDEPTDYWTKLFGKDPPFPVIRDDWESLPGYSKEVLRNWPQNINQVVAWWIQTKRQYAENLVKDIGELSKADCSLEENITVIIPTSPIPTHPSTAVLDETISTIRKHLPRSEIILTFDGVREQQKDRIFNYEEYINRVLWKCLHEWGNVLPIIFDEQSHQVKMARKALEYVRTPIILYAEADCPLTPDRDIEWSLLTQKILDGTADVIRLHHEALVLSVHEHLMLGGVENNMRKTFQWSQRPHLASTAYYKRILNEHFTPDANAFIEDRMYGVLEQAVRIDGKMGWHNHRVWMYTPPGDIKRSYTTDGRGEDKKFDDQQVF